MSSRSRRQRSLHILLVSAVFAIRFPHAVRFTRFGVANLYAAWSKLFRHRSALHCGRRSSSERHRLVSRLLRCGAWDDSAWRVIECAVGTIVAITESNSQVDATWNENASQIPITCKHSLRRTVCNLYQTGKVSRPSGDAQTCTLVGYTQGQICMECHQQAPRWASLSGEPESERAHLSYE